MMRRPPSSCLVVMCAAALATGLRRLAPPSAVGRMWSTTYRGAVPAFPWGRDGEPAVTVKAAYASITAHLEACGVPEADIAARMFLCDVTRVGYRASDFARAQGLVLTADQLDTLTRYSQQRVDRVPVQYVIGNWDFYGMTVLCRPPVLCPRPETEELVERILATGLLQAVPRPRILDVGAGTGVIGLALLRHLPPAATCDALDINPVAVALATDNAKSVLPGPDAGRYTCRLQSFDAFVASGVGLGQYDLVVSNPPYIPTGELAGLEPEVAWHEDHGALDGGADGLDIVRPLLTHSASLLRPGGPGEVWLEVAPQHPALVRALLAPGGPCAHVGLAFVEGIDDLSGNPRFVRMRRREA